ncbi:ATP-binding protein [Gluconacetobacter sp. 1c LMG 22058]|uniref:ATP-binding protein n=1 Tax=Gluconacetobacter dulcium TaxID=2729096 RepID=A0A7W4K3U0_9PROT|nr:ATP-binding protein [Gluconacetobacter dulcium]MBB2199740.1 ATP-binding protein [Gluconacetobacter dulcium]
MAIAKPISDAEALIAAFEARGTNCPKLDEVRAIVASALLHLLDWANQGQTLDDVLEAMVSSEKPNRDAMLFVARVLNVPDVLPVGRADSFQFQRRFVGLFARIVPDLSGNLGLGNFKQTVDKINAVASLQARAAQLLEPLAHLSTVPAVFLSSRQSVFQILNNGLLKSYLHPFKFAERSTYIKEVYSLIEDLLDCRDATFVLKIDQCEQKIAEAEAAVVDDRDLFSIIAYGPYLVSARAVLSAIRAESVERLHCLIRPRRPAPNVIERRFPLQEANRVFRATLPLINDGPGLAIDTVVTVVADDQALVLQDERLSIGSVEPGEFAVTFDVLVGDPVTQAKLLVEVSWSTAQSTSRESESFDVLLSSQDPNVPWDTLEGDDPYSTEVAYGDEFVGRRAKVTALQGRLRRPRMQSSYITGQKRVGKTSLAFAVRDHVISHATADSYEFIYLEYGEYASSDANKTVTALGKAIATNLSLHLPPELRPEDLDFDGTIAPLNHVASTLAKVVPDKRFVIVLDEFDEIHPEMYRYGSLAEAFFSNLRTLSAKQNIAMMLVGGENMPFIIGAQGDQLNKYVQEQLSYFSRSAEWEDYVDIVRLKNTSPLTWYESALSEIFRVTNGHPYYTKLLCARIFQNAVQDRDTEITLDEVACAVRGLIENLDTNSFAHFWKDGIAADRDKAEITELKRKRVLVALGQTKRSSVKLTFDNIITNLRNLSIQSTEVPPILNDFVRRDILRERSSEYSFVLPLFEEWLVQRGVGKLISDTFGDEMAEALRKLEDEAFVSANEIANTISSWPPYRGKERGVGDIQAWLEQRESLLDRRILFKLVQSLRFVREEEIRDKLRVAHNIVKQHMTAFTPENRSQRRFDIAVTYVDGVGKSGAKIAEKYAEANLISSTCVVEQASIAGSIGTLERGRSQPVRGIVIIDDIAATGESLAQNLENFLTRNIDFLILRKLPVVVIALLATEAADQAVRAVMTKWSGISIDFRVCEYLREDSFAFSERSLIWKDSDERDRAKALVSEIGRVVCKPAPLGFGNLALLLAFTDTVPNNTLPVIHASGTGWRALLERPKN